MSRSRTDEGAHDARARYETRSRTAAARRRTRALATLLAAAIASTGCLTPSGEEKLGADAAKEVAATMGLAAESNLTRYVRSLCERLAEASARPEGPWSFQVADASEPNAFAIPGGHVYVTRGLLALVNSEDELAGVMGHELAHVTERHTSKRLSAAVITSPITLVTGIAGFAAGIVSPTVGDAVAGTGTAISQGLVLAPYSRSQETDADRVGQELAAATGYDPAALPRLLHTLERETTRLSGEAPKFSFFANHPMTPKRVEETEARAKTLTPVNRRPIVDHAGLLEVLDGLVVGPDPAQGVFRDQLFLHPVLDFAVAFPAGWQTMNNATAVGAQSPDTRAVVVLQLAATDTTMEKVEAQLRSEAPDLTFESLEINGLRAVRTRLSQRGTRAVLTWIEYRGNIYAIVGRTDSGTAYDTTLEKTATSFRALRKSEEASIETVRLRLRKARAGETPAALARRTGSAWDAEQIAIANGVASGAKFDENTSVKIALPEPWREERHSGE
jgi:predicted Zn-dependent protease